jgi:hypothetical protein
LLGPAWAAAQAPPEIQPNVSIGLSGGQNVQESALTRNGTWAPVYITLHGNDRDGNPQGVYQLAIESTDLDDKVYRYVVPVPALEPGQDRVVVGYTFPMDSSSDFTIKLESVGKPPRVVQVLANQRRGMGEDSIISSDQAVFLGVGGILRDLKQIVENPDGEAVPPGPEKGPVRPRPTRPTRYAALISDPALLPDRWFGYQAADVVVLTTGNKDFVNKLAEKSGPPEVWRSALREWVYRGGRLVISVGSNVQETVPLLGSLLPGLDCSIAHDPALAKQPLRTLSRLWCNQQQELEATPLAALKPGAGVQTLVREGDRPVIVQTSFGLGRVLLVGFDLDTGGFSRWKGRAAFWDRLQAELVPPVNRQVAPGVVNMPGFVQDDHSQIQAALKKGLEPSVDVPPVSFAWVALFLLFYIALVGPIDYFILKKVFKRLELTWITFPLTVVVVSVLAYFTAYSMKGGDLYINKIDLVEIDYHPESRQVVGTTWFGLFSPRVESYTMGLEPASPVWADPPAEKVPGPVLSLLEGSDRAVRTGTQGLFPQPYEYAPDATGIRNIQVPVWAVRWFTGSWRAPLPVARPAVEVRDLADQPGALSLGRGGGSALVGKITNNLGVELEGATLIFREKCYDLGTLAPGESRLMQAVEARLPPRDLGTWFKDPHSLEPTVALTRSGRVQDRLFLDERSAFVVMKPLLFYQAAGTWPGSNGGLRQYDQSWRLLRASVIPLPERPEYRPEAILVARLPLMVDGAEKTTTHPCSATRLWLGSLPGEQPSRPSLSGYLTQETYLRVYIPVKAR